MGQERPRWLFGYDDTKWAALTTEYWAMVRIRCRVGSVDCSN